MTKATKEEAIDLYLKFIKADLELYNSTCKEGLEIRLEDLVSHLCFEQKIKLSAERFDKEPVENWWDEMVHKDDEVIFNAKSLNNERD